MYFRRLKTFLILIGLILLAWACRLAYLQIARGNHYRRQAEDSLIRAPRFTPTERGRIVDRYDRLLAHDVPSYGVAVDYRILAGDARHLVRTAGKYRRGMTPAQLAAAAAPIRAEYDRLLADLAHTCGVSSRQLVERRRQILAQVAAIQRAVSRRLGRPTPIPEQRMAHTLIGDLPGDLVNRLITRLCQVDGVRLASTKRRNYPWGRCMAHLVGTDGPVSPDDLDDDPFADHQRRRYLPGEHKGLTGIERSAEGVLRGWRGLTRLDRDGRQVQNIPVVRGGHVRLCIDANLQRQVYRVLARHVDASPFPAGGAVVVINVGERTDHSGRPLHDGEVLALVNYPSFDPNRWQADYERLLADARGQPLLFRAVAGVYPPGSVVKPAVLAAALAEGAAPLDTPLNCPGYLISPTYRAFRCWNRFGHGDLLPSDALKHSCNVYFFKIGQRMGLPTLTEWLDHFGLCRDQHTGLIEERRGTLPTPLWLAAHRADYAGYSPADARNVAIGQGDLGATPLAVANLMATIARGGVFLHPLLVAAPTAQRRQGTPVGVRAEYMKIVQEGLDRVVNETGGTGRKYAHMETTRLAGKTGSAQASRRRIDGRLFPPTHHADGGAIRPAHAWFAGYAPAGAPAIAVACLVEYGMSGGRAAGPLARDVLQLCINLDYIPAPMANKREVPGAAPPPAGAPPTR